MRLVHHEQPDATGERGRLDKRSEERRKHLLGRHEENLQNARLEERNCLDERLWRCGSGEDERRKQRRQLLVLVLHQCDERRDHERDFVEQRGQLVRQGLSAARGSDEELR